MMAMLPMGSTRPLSAPMPNDFQRVLPSARSGMEMMAPSGMFWMAMPSDTASALAAVMLAPPFNIVATTTPTAMPSGMLWMVTASASIDVRDRWLCGPSGLPSPGCRCGMSSSIRNRNPIPASTPNAAGMTDAMPSPPAISMLGMSKDHTAAATITPEAKPSSVRSSRPDMAPRIKKTNAEPSTVPANGIVNARMSPSICLAVDVSCGYFAGSHLQRTGDTMAPSFFNSANALSTSLRSAFNTLVTSPADTGLPASRMACKTCSFMMLFV